MDETPHDTRPEERDVDSRSDLLPEERDVDSRSDLLPEERAAGSDRPHDQAEAVLEESAQRTSDPEGTQLTSTQTPDEGRTSDEPVT
jgi:hypothetical protein